MHTVRILHFSDLRWGDPAYGGFRRERVIGGDRWLSNLDDLVKDGSPDMLCVTGDLAWSGDIKEYEDLTRFLRTTCNRAGVPWEHVFVVPGNHDIVRGVHENAWRKLRSIQPEEYRRLGQWMVGGATLRDIEEQTRDDLLQRQSAFRAWVQDTLRPALLPNERSPHPTLGYRETIQLRDRPFPVHIIGLDSAWLSGDDNDSGKLRLTDEQVGRLVSTSDGQKLSGLRLALMHHPLDELDRQDRSLCRDILTGSVDILLHGHSHETDPKTRTDPNGSLPELGAGCLYNHPLYRSTCHMVVAVCDDPGEPLHFDLVPRIWSAKGHWHADNTISERIENGRLRWWSRPNAASALGAPLTSAAPAVSMPAMPTALAPMPAIREIRMALVKYFNTSPRIRMLLQDAGVDTNKISFDGAASDIWNDSISEAIRAKRLRQLLDFAGEEYPNADDVRALAARTQA